MDTKGVSIIIPTLNGGGVFRQSLKRIAEQDYGADLELIVIDSGSTDGTPDVARGAGARVVQIPQSEFHHARTRNKAFLRASFDKIIFLVQDAIPVSAGWLAHMAGCIHGDISAAFGRPLPHEDADMFAYFETMDFFEYLGDSPVVRSLESYEKFKGLLFHEALFSVRHDNICSIYTREVLEDCPFPDVDFGEDLAWAKLALLKGYKTLYSPRSRRDRVRWHTESDGHSEWRHRSQRSGLDREWK